MGKGKPNFCHELKIKKKKKEINLVSYLAPMISVMYFKGALEFSE